MWTHRSFMQLITSEIQKPSRCCGQSSQFVIASSWWWALSLQVSFINVYSNLIIDWPPRWFPEWVGDLESETGGRIGLWKVCERNEMSDNCAGKLEDMMDMQSMSFQVNFNFFSTGDCSRIFLFRSRQFSPESPWQHRCSPSCAWCSWFSWNRQRFSTFAAGCRFYQVRISLSPIVRNINRFHVGQLWLISNNFHSAISTLQLLPSMLLKRCGSLGLCSFSMLCVGIESRINADNRLEVAFWVRHLSRLRSMVRRAKLALNT